MNEMHDGASPAPEQPSVLVRPRRKGIYILPNLFTLAALFGGFYAIVMAMNGRFELDRKSTRLNSSHSQISYAVFCLKKKKNLIHTQIKDASTSALTTVLRHSNMITFTI